ncbi:MAG: hypothetical protein PHO79_08010 [Desulfoplanes sp.]|nr:hypothetical protein [Desulfoplanes sp.]
MHTTQAPLLLNNLWTIHFKPMRTMQHLRMLVQHYCNPLHVYCRLRELGIASSVALRMCTIYEKIIFSRSQH